MSDKKEKKWDIEAAAEKTGEDISRGLKKGWDKGRARTKDAITEGKGKDKKDD